MYCRVSLFRQGRSRVEPGDKVDPRREPVTIGIDVGSTTVKAVVVDAQTKEILWSDYQRHQTKQPEFVLSFLQRIEACFPNVEKSRCRIDGRTVEKPHATVAAGMVLTFALGPRVKVVRIVALGERRGPAPEARTLYEEIDSP